ncbi:uncharacterized protein Mb2253c-like [Trifolium pratense]|uniref:Uncharacterized protein n=2 Tax=Trifolium pratense TaxID=57577 RepID=A0ACB0LA66_TRIPR|nr:uncharacterized protein Mb2253c-like [Trifolium pratense]XP_045812390.1 uncharacterized protein Mb2253c-like [Trifolium pratense]CAJ2665500.1 unnamed protein product [Trifolium pratense]CAJ2665511.1 unnamed protein product [Trifolium pratense]
MSNQRSCILMFDGASRGNPGPAGAGAALFSENRTLLYRFRQGLGYQTNNAAEYHALILGLNQAFYKGYRNINIQGDSQLVVKQFLGEYNINNPQLRSLCQEASEIARKFRSVNVQHIPREWNSEADAQANRAINLGDGQVEEERVYY